jgi:hypothetical protein
MAHDTLSHARPIALLPRLSPLVTSLLPIAGQTARRKIAYSVVAAERERDTVIDGPIGRSQLNSAQVARRRSEQISNDLLRYRAV